MSRRIALRALGATALGVVGACGRGAGERPIVVYSSADDEIAGAVIERFERAFVAPVSLRGDTEATKTTGLMVRLLAERGAPRADVWWSSEPLGTIRLAREGVLRPAPGVFGGLEGLGWPPSLVAPDRSWAGFSQRARVIAFHTGRVPADPPITSVRALLDPRWRGRIGLARPAFGTTRVYMSAILAARGEAALVGLLRALGDNGARLYDGNSAVVRAIAGGEIDLGLTDSDDAHGAARNGWPVGHAFEAPGGDDGAPGALLMPNTVGLVAGRPASPGAEEFAKFLVSEEVERLMADAGSRHLPVRPSVGDGYASGMPLFPWRPDFVAVEARAERAIELCAAHLGA